jgi:septum formation protein
MPQARAELVLASTSPRRRELLRQLGRPFRVRPHRADETLPDGLTPAQAAERLAVRKARSVANDLPRGIVLGADTLVAAATGPVGSEDLIGKPRDRAHAITILTALTARPHYVITGICCIDAASGREVAASDATRVTLRPMTRDEIEAYVDSGEAMGKAGAYAIQETGDRFVERIEGSLSNVVGLPMELLVRVLALLEGPAS